MVEIFSKNIIPKIIYYCWFGGDKPKKVLDCINNWHEKMPDYQIIEVNEKNKKLFDVEEECKNNKWFKICYEQKIWALVSDYARLKVLYENGGIYFDTDVTVEGNIQKIIDKNKLVIGWESNKYINAAVIISAKNDKNIKQMSDFYNTRIWNEPIYTIPAIMTTVLKENYNLNKYSQITENEEILVLPPDYFYPIPVGIHNVTRDEICFYITAETIAVHWNHGNWSPYSSSNNILYFGRHKHNCDLNKLLDYCFIEKIIIENPFIKITKFCTSLSININWYWLCRFKYRSDKRKNRWLVLFLIGFSIRLWKIENENERKT